MGLASSYTVSAVGYAYFIRQPQFCFMWPSIASYFSTLTSTFTTIDDATIWLVAKVSFVSLPLTLVAGIAVHNDENVSFFQVGGITTGYLVANYFMTSLVHIWSEHVLDFFTVRDGSSWVGPALYGMEILYWLLPSTTGLQLAAMLTTSKWGFKHYRKISVSLVIS